MVQSHYVLHTYTCFLHLYSRSNNLRIISAVCLHLLIFTTQLVNVSSVTNCGTYIGHVLTKIYCGARPPHIVDLSHCEIETVDKDAFKCLKGVRKLLLDDNRLATLPAGLFQNLGRMHTLSIQSKHDN